MPKAGDVLICPAPHCGHHFTALRHLTRHWRVAHHSYLGSYEAYSQRRPAASIWGSEVCYAAPEAEDAAAHDDCGDAIDAIAVVALEHIDRMKYQYFETNAEVDRAKALAADVLKAAGAAVSKAVAANMDSSSNIQQVIESILGALDQVNTRKQEAAFRRRVLRRANVPQLNVHAREICQRNTLTTASTSRKAQRAGTADIGYAYETRLEEVLERELTCDPSLIDDWRAADLHWTKVNRNRCDPRSPGRQFRDVCDGEVWAHHPFLGDAHYSGPLRLAFIGYCDDVDVPNPIGPSAGDHKLFLSYTVLLNRCLDNRLRLVSINLASVCLASDAKLAGPSNLISGRPGESVGSTSVGATFRRFHEGVELSIQASTGEIKRIPVRGWLIAWTADGMAAGEICGTNSSFSRAHNICNLCEDGLQGDPRKNRTPCGFLCCTCPEDADSHRCGCKCHFKLRTPARDEARMRRGSTAAQRQRLGIVTEQHAFVRVPHFHIALFGPKDVMHVFLEGVTKHFAAHLFFMLHHKLGVSKGALSRALLDYQFGGGEHGAKLCSLDYIPDSIYTKTKVRLPSGAEIWGPHKEAKVPASAYGVLLFAIHSLEILRPFAPQAPWPSWWEAWVWHVSVLGSALRFTYTFSDLEHLEDMTIKWQRCYFNTPEFYDCWIPKHHWALHLAHDIWRWGPPRLLWCMLMEMKNRTFKLGCKRSNFHNPPKAAAEFWADASAFQLRTRRGREQPYSSDDAFIVLSGHVADFPHMQHMLHSLPIAEEQLIETLSSVKLHGVPVPRASYLMEMSDHGTLHLWKVVEIFRLVDAPTTASNSCTAASHFIMLLSMGDIRTDKEYSSYYVTRDDFRGTDGRLVSADVCANSMIALWHCRGVNENDPNVALRFIVKW